MSFLDDIVKKYPIKNDHWKFISDDDLSLFFYINSEIHYSNLPEGIYSDVTRYFVRKKVYPMDYKITNTKLENLLRMDPWNREFKCFPFEKCVGNNTYGWDGDVYGWSAIRDVAYQDEKAYVITTTVNNKKVYCLDILW